MMGISTVYDFISLPFSKRREILADLGVKAERDGHIQSDVDFYKDVFAILRAQNKVAQFIASVAAAAALERAGKGK